MIPGQLIAPGQLTDLGVNFASVHGLTPVTVHMSFSLPQGNFKSGLPVVQHQVTHLAEVTFLLVNRTQKLSRGKQYRTWGYETILLYGGSTFWQRFVRTF